MKKKKMLAMLLAGGQGSRLYSLTNNIAKPAVSFGGKYRIIDFGLSNCVNSGIDTVGILVQYKPLVLNRYVGTGESWDMDVPDGGVHILPPYAGKSGGEWYEGTADAIFHNIDFIDMYSPENVLILSGDHIYKMNYNLMLEEHEANNSDLTVSVIEVPWEEASRFGIMTADNEGNIVKFSEKPKEPDSNLASMGIYIFKWDTLRKALLEDHENKDSSHDFGNDIIPKLLAEGRKLTVYRFAGYWRDVGTVQSYYDSQMDLMDDVENIDVFTGDMKVFSNSNVFPPQYLGREANIRNSLVCNGCTVYGSIKHSILGSGSVVLDGTVIEDSIILPNAWVGRNCRITRAIINEGTDIGKEEMDMKTIGLISANYGSSEFGALLENRSLASLPYGGRYRLIDFELSNMANAGITTVGVIAPTNSGSLVDHIGVGNPWSLARKKGGLFVMPGSIYGMQKSGSRFLMRDLLMCSNFFIKDDADFVIMSGSSDVCNMDYEPIIKAHAESGKPITMVYKKVPRGEEFHGYFLDIDENGKVNGINTESFGWSNYFADTFIINRKYMIDFMDWYRSLEYMDMIEIIKDNISTIDIGTFEFRGYLGKIKNPWEFLKVNQAMTDYDIRNEVFCNPERLIYTKAQDEAPVFHYPDADVRNSVISAGCRIEGRVENSVIFRSCHIAKGAVVRNSVIMMHGTIGEGAVLDNVIADKYVTINPGVKIYGGEREPVIIGKNQSI